MLILIPLVAYSYEEVVVYSNEPVVNHPVELVEEASLNKGVFCVEGVRILGADVPKGDAMDLKVFGPPLVGGVVKLTYGNTVDDYHLAYIMAILPKGMYVGEYNYHRKGEYGERFIPFTDPAIIGYWSSKKTPD